MAVQMEAGAPMTGTDEIIQTVDLNKVYPGTDFKAVDNLNLSVGRGEIFGLLGPNGAGKTTTVGMLTTRVVPSSGQARRRWHRRRSRTRHWPSRSSAS